MPSKLEYGAGTNVGLVRTNNEDCYLAEPDYGLWLIADGMGGHDAGEVASGIVKESVFQSVKDSTSLKDAIHKSHADVKQAAEQNIGSPNMGTTIISLLSNSANYELAWVGDSRAYLWDTITQQLSQLSKDHSYVQTLYDAGAISEEEMHSHPQKNIITQSLGVSELDKVHVDTYEGQWSLRQKILLCSDGLSDLTTDKEIADLFRKHQTKSNQELTNALITMALDKGGTDNVTVAVISAPNNIDALSITHKSITPTAKITAIAAISILSLGLIWQFLF